MRNLILTELMKLRRCPILLVGIVAMTLCPPAQLATQVVIIEELRNPNFNMAALMNAVIWGNAQVFLPISVAMIGGYMMNREYTDNTLGQALCVPVSFGKLMTGKLLGVLLIAALLAAYSFIVALLTALIAKLPGINAPVLAKGLAQLVLTALGTCVACSPVIALGGMIPGAYLGGAVAAFLMGYSSLFFKSGPLRSAYPFLAAFALAGFDTAGFNGARHAASLPVAALSLSATALVTAGIVRFARPPQMKERRQKTKPVRHVER